MTVVKLVAPQAQAAPPSAAKKTRQPDKFNRFAWRDDVFADPDTPSNAKVLAHGIADHVNGRTGEARLSEITLAKVCGKSRAWARKTIPVLAATGWMEVQVGRRGRGPDHCSVYKINQTKGTPRVLLSDPAKGHFSPIKGHPGCQEPLNHIEERPFRPRSEYVERGEENTSLDGDRAFSALLKVCPFFVDPDEDQSEARREFNRLIGEGVDPEAIITAATTFYTRDNTAERRQGSLTNWLRCRTAF